MTRLAATHRVRPTAPRFGTIVDRDLEAIAIENALEGCVNETWAAADARDELSEEQVAVVVAAVPLRALTCDQP